MKKFIILFLITTTAFSVNAQTRRVVRKKTTTTVAAKPTPPPPPPKPVIIAPKVDEYSVKGKNFLDPGIGLGDVYNGISFGASFEHGFTDAISGGVFFDYSSYNNGFDDAGYKLSVLYAGVRASYHFAKLLNLSIPQLDPYAGVSVGYYDFSYSFQGTDYFNPHTNTVFAGVHAGARYMFSNNIGGFAEVGYGVSVLRVGVSFKF